MPKHKKLKVGQLVWAQYKNDYIWPGKIMEQIPRNPPKGDRKDYYYVYFFGHHSQNIRGISRTEMFCYVPRTHVHKYIDIMEIQSRPPRRKNRFYISALNYAHEQHWCLEELKREDPLTSGYYRTSDDEKDLQEDDRKAGRPVRRVMKKRGRKKSTDPSPVIPRDPNAPKVEDSIAYCVPYIEDCSNLPDYIDNPDGTLTLINVFQDRQTCPLFNPRFFHFATVPSFPRDGIPACRQCRVKFAFIGALRNNAYIMKKILQKKHHVTMWTKLTSKYEEFCVLGAHRSHTPEEAIRNSDVIFCSLPDADVNPAIRYATAGIYDGFENSKGKRKIYISFTSLNDPIDQELRNSIIKLGGIYFEIKMMQPMLDGNKKPDILICAGDMDVYEEVKMYLLHITDDIHYFGPKFGEPTRRFVPSCLTKNIPFRTFRDTLEDYERLGYPLINVGTIDKCHLT